MFESSFFGPPATLLTGALTGLVFGFLLEKGGVTRYRTIVGQLLLRDFTMLRIMLTAIVVGGVGVWGMHQLGWIEGLHVKSAAVAGNALGGAIFGAGMALLGYCPGTGLAAFGSGARDAGFGVLGMLFGAALYAEAHPWFAARVLGVGDLGNATLPGVSGLSPWWFLLALAVLAVALFAWLERRGGRAARPAGGRLREAPEG